MRAQRAPFFGKATSYITTDASAACQDPPGGDAFARRPRCRSGSPEIRNCLAETLKPQGVAVVIEAQHMCM